MGQTDDFLTFMARRVVAWGSTIVGIAGIVLAINAALTNEFVGAGRVPSGIDAGLRGDRVRVLARIAAQLGMLARQKDDVAAPHSRTPSGAGDGDRRCRAHARAGLCFQSTRGSCSKDVRSSGIRRSHFGTWDFRLGGRRRGWCRCDRFEGWFRCCLGFHRRLDIRRRFGRFSASSHSEKRNDDRRQ